MRDVRGFATKFYTEDGNYDLVANNIPIFFIQDAIKFPDIVHSIKPEPHNDIPQASAARGVTPGQGKLGLKTGASARNVIPLKIIGNLSIMTPDAVCYQGFRSMLWVAYMLRMVPVIPRMTREWVSVVRPR